MARLPRPGSDNDIWGDILNEYLAVEHADDGTLRNNYAIMIGGGRRIYVQDTEPTDMQEGDIWIDTSGI